MLWYTNLYEQNLRSKDFWIKLFKMFFLLLRGEREKTAASVLLYFCICTQNRENSCLIKVYTASQPCTHTHTQPVESRLGEPLRLLWCSECAVIGRCGVKESRQAELQGGLHCEYTLSYKVHHDIFTSVTWHYVCVSVCVCVSLAMSTGLVDKKSAAFWKTIISNWLFLTCPWLVWQITKKNSHAFVKGKKMTKAFFLSNIHLCLVCLIACWKGRSWLGVTQQQGSVGQKLFFVHEITSFFLPWRTQHLREVLPLPSLSEKTSSTSVAIDNVLVRSPAVARHH